MSCSSITSRGWLTEVIHPCRSSVSPLSCSFVTESPAPPRRVRRVAPTRAAGIAAYLGDAMSRRTETLARGAHDGAASALATTDQAACSAATIRPVARINAGETSSEVASRPRVLRDQPRLAHEARVIQPRGLVERVRVLVVHMNRSVRMPPTSPRRRSGRTLPTDAQEDSAGASSSDQGTASRGPARCPRRYDVPVRLTRIVPRPARASSSLSRTQRVGPFRSGATARRRAPLERGQEDERGHSPHHRVARRSRASKNPRGPSRRC